MRTIARYTIIEFVRKKMLYIIVGLGALLMIGTIFAGGLALTEQTKIIRDFSLGLIEIAGVILVLFFASHVLQQEITQNTIFLLLSKNIKRSNIILGKFWGFVGVVLFFMTVMGLLYRGITSLYHVQLSVLHLYALIGLTIKLCVLIALCLFFASFVSPFVALLASIVIYILGHTMGFVVYYITVLKKDNFSPFMGRISKIFYYIFPNFTSLSINNFFDTPFASEMIGKTIGFSSIFHIFYIIIILFLTTKIFKKKVL